jgi:hypothetical protein
MNKEILLNIFYITLFISLLGLIACFFLLGSIEPFKVNALSYFWDVSATSTMFTFTFLFFTGIMSSIQIIAIENINTLKVKKNILQILILSTFFASALISFIPWALHRELHNYLAFSLITLYLLTMIICGTLLNKRVFKICIVLIVISFVLFATCALIGSYIIIPELLVLITLMAFTSSLIKEM